MNLKVLVILFALFLCQSTSLHSQTNSSSSSLFDPEIIYQIQLVDGSIFVGNIIENQGNQIKVVTLSEIEMKIPMKKVHGIVKYIPGDPIAQKNISSPNIASEGAYDPTSYLVNNSAFTLKEGESFYKNHYLFVNSFKHGVTDNFQITGGFEAMSIFAAIANGGYTGGPVLYGSAKAGSSVSEQFHLAGIFSIIAIPGQFNDGGLFASAGGVATFGTPENNFSTGVSLAFSPDANPLPMLTLAGMFRISDHASLITENWILSDDIIDLPINISAGIRFHGSKTYFDIALITNEMIMGEFFAIPFLSAGIKY